MSAIIIHCVRVAATKAQCIPSSYWAVKNFLDKNWPSKRWDFHYQAPIMDHYSPCSHQIDSAETNNKYYQ